MNLPDGWLMIQEAAYLAQLVRAVGALDGDFLEVGSWYGRSTVAIGREVKMLDGHLYCIDIWNREVAEEDAEEHKSIMEKYWRSNVRKHIFKGDSYASFTENIKKYGLTDVVTPIIGLSSRVIKNWEQPLRFVFIDGTHEAKYIREDARWKKYLVVGGIIAFHDYRATGVVRKPVNEEMDNSPDFGVEGQVRSVKAFRRLKL